jgi:hypothetical protein
MINCCIQAHAVNVNGFVILLSLSRRETGYILKICHHRFLPNPFLLTTHDHLPISLYVIQSVPRNSEPTYWHATAMLCVVTDSFPGSSLAAVAARCRGGFHDKWDILKTFVARSVSNQRSCGKINITAWSGYHSCFVFGSFGVQISARRPTTLRIFVTLLRPPGKCRGNTLN